MACKTNMTGLLCLLSAGLLGAVPVDLCVEPSFESAVAVMRLDEADPSLTLRPVEPERCAAADGYRAQFVGRDGRVALVLWTPTGERLERAVPWARRAEDALVGLDRQGRLGSLAVLLAGLVLEDRALRAMSRRSPPLASGVPSLDERWPPSAVGLDEPQIVGPPLDLDRDRPSAAPEPPVAVPARGRSSRVVRAGAIEGARPRDTAVAARRRGGAHPLEMASSAERIRGAASTTAALALARAEPNDDAPVRPPPPPEAAPFTNPGPTPSAAMGPDGAGEAGGPGAVAGDAPGVTAAPLERPAAVQVGASVGAALRAPSLLGLEAALRVEAFGVSLEAGGLAPVVWELEGRPLEVSAAWAILGWSPRLWTGAAVGVDGRLGAVTERWTVLRLEVPDAVTRALWDTGLDGSVTVSGATGGGWHVGGTVGVRWLATANDILIPDGPRAAINNWQGRFGLTVGWDP